MRDVLCGSTVMIGFLMIWVSFGLESAAFVRCGGLTFWRLGRVGGSFYVARKG